MSTYQYFGTLVVIECCTCHMDFGMTPDYDRDRLNDHDWFYCPAGHRQHYKGKSDEQKLRDAEARETALRDQLQAAACEAERVRGALLRDRHRFANGVCPCCNRSFDNVRRHMTTKHPDYDVTKVQQKTPPMFPCSCGRKFGTLAGLHRHQTIQRSSDWFKPERANSWGAHLTKVDR